MSVNVSLIQRTHNVSSARKSVADVGVFFLPPLAVVKCRSVHAGSYPTNVAISFSVIIIKLDRRVSAGVARAFISPACL